MNALTRTPLNTNNLQASKYLLMFDRIPTIQYFCQTANIPGVSVGTSTVSAPTLDFKVAGNKLTYEQFEIEFIVDESIQSWHELYKWLLAFGSPKSLHSRANETSLQTGALSYIGNYSEATLTVMSALNNPLYRINYHKIFPVSVSGIQFDTKESADTIITATATFAYEYFEITTA
jgi:hypothetical protein